MNKVLLLLGTVWLLTACGTSRKAMSPDRFRQMTRTEIAAGYDTVFSSTLSILQAQAFLITAADKESGLILANKRIDNKYNFWDDLLFGSYVKANTAKVSFLLRALTPVQTEVKLTIYAGDEEVRRDSNQRQYTEKSSSFVDNPRPYTSWFDHLRHEVNVRKGIIAVEPPGNRQTADSIQP